VKPPQDDVDWEDFGIDGCAKFLGRVWRLVTGEAHAGAPARSGDPTAADLEVDRGAHRLTDRVTRDFDRWSYNTAVAACMEYTNDLYRYVQAPEGPHGEVLETALDRLLLVMAPMVPHLTAELWERRHGRHIHAEPWPTADPAKLRAERVTLVVQVNGKVRDRLEVDAAIDESEAVQHALASARVQRHLDGGSPRRVIARPPKLVNLVV